MRGRRKSLPAQLQRMPHIGGGEEIRALAILDALAQDARWAEIGSDVDPDSLLVARADLADDLAQAAGGENPQTLGSRHPD